MVDDGIKPVRTGAGGGGGRIGDLQRPAMPAKPRPPRPPGRLRGRMPTMAQLKALIATGRLLLPPRYVRGYFLDLLV